VAGNSNDIAALAQQQPAQLRALEHRHAAAAARPLARALATAETDATGRWMLATTPEQAIPSPANLQTLIEHIRKALEAAFYGQGAYAMAEAQRAAYTAASLGIQHASRITALLRGVPPPTNIPPETGPVADRAAGAIPAAVQEEHSHALALLTTAGLTAFGLAGLKSVFSRARRAVTRITAGVAVAITSAAAHASLTVARYLGPGVRMLWVAEPGACPACAAYAGRTVRPGGHPRHKPAGPAAATRPRRYARASLRPRPKDCLTCPEELSTRSSSMSCARCTSRAWAVMR
jgi:hypothetical protein